MWEWGHFLGGKWEGAQLGSGAKDGDSMGPQHQSIFLNASLSLSIIRHLLFLEPHHDPYYTTIVVVCLRRSRCHPTTLLPYYPILLSPTNFP